MYWLHKVLVLTLTGWQLVWIPPACHRAMQQQQQQLMLA